MIYIILGFFGILLVFCNKFSKKFTKKHFLEKKSVALFLKSL